MQIGLAHYLVIAAILFSIGLFVVLTRRNAVGVLMGVELILNSANVNLVAFNHFQGGILSGQVFALFVMVLAAAEAVVALAIVLGIYQNLRTIEVTAADTLRD
jgi:NADH-quinone oxidoreductase subunit K